MDTKELRNYFMHELKWGWGHQQKIVFDFLCEAAEAAKGGVVLDAGAGHQRYKPFFDDSIYIAQEHPFAGQQNKNIEEYDILSDIKNIPLRDNSVDVVLSTSSLEHIEFPDLFFSESFRVLKPGGSLYINVPFAYPEHEIPYDFQRPTRYGLLRHYSHAGFEETSVFPTSSSIYSAQFLFLSAVREESQRIRQTFLIRIFRKIVIGVTKVVCKIAMLLFDKGPMKDTTLPIGWISKGYKKGTKNVGPVYDSKKYFINHNAQCDSTVVLQDGRILPTEIK